MDAKAKELIRQEKEKRRLEREQKKKEQLERQNLEKAVKISSHGSEEQGSFPHLQLNVIKNAQIPNDTKETTQSLHYGEGYFKKNRTQEPSAPTNKESQNRNLRDQFEIYTSNVQKFSEDEEHLEKIKKQKHQLSDDNVINELSDTCDSISAKQRNAILTTQNGNVHYTPKIEDREKIPVYEVDQHKEPNIGVDEDIIKNNGTIEETYELIESDNEDDIDGLRFSKNEEAWTPNWKTKEIFFKRTEEMTKDGESSNSKMELEEELNERFSRNMKDFKINTEAENVEEDLIKEGFSYSNFETMGEMDTEKFDEWFQEYIHNIENHASDHSAYYEEVEYLLQLLKDKKKKLVGNLCDDDKKKEAPKLTEEDILDELETFHKNVNIDIDKKEKNWNARDNETGKKKAPVYDIDQIYEELGIQKREEEEVIGFALNENEKEIIDGKENGKEKGKRKEKEKENTNGIAEKKDVQRLPKGFFDDKEKKEYLKAQSDLAKIDEQIQFLENEKRTLLQEYENAGFVYDEKINNYIDYLYDDGYASKEVIMQQIKEKNYKGDHTKGEHIRLIEEMLKDKKKKKEKGKIKK